MKKQIVLTIIALTLTALMLSIVAVKADDFIDPSNLHLVPQESISTGAPVITTNNPTTCDLSITANNIKLTSVWLILVIDEATYTGGGSITVQGPVSPSKSVTIDSTNFLIVTGDVPPSSAGTAPNGVDSYPGCPTNEAYNKVDKQIGGGKTYYTYIDITGTLTGSQLLSGFPQKITITISGDNVIKVLVLVMGHDANDDSTTGLGQRSPYSESTLFVLPEYSLPLIGICSCFAAFAIYKKGRGILHL
jgi:hypothetical protein